MELLVGLAVLIVGSFGTIWYKLGKLTSEVKNHNRMLTEIQKAIEKLLSR